MNLTRLPLFLIALFALVLILLDSFHDPAASLILANTLMLVNPRKRGRGRRSRGAVGFVRSFSPSMSNLTPMLIGALQGAGGALAVNAVLRFAPLPAMLVTGRAIYLTRAALALGVGWLASNVLSNRVALRMAEGALTVVAVDALRDVLLQTTGVNLSGGLGYYSPARLVNRGPNVIQIPGMSGMGKNLSKYVNPGALHGAANRGAARPGYGMPS